MVRLARIIALISLAAFASTMLGERALATGLAAALPGVGAAHTDVVKVFGGGCGKYGCPLEPPYAFYPPPRVALRCFDTRYGDVHCPYASWGKKDTGACWTDAWGRRVCGPDAYHARPAYHGSDYPMK